MVGKKGDFFLLSDNCFIDTVNGQIIDTYNGEMVSRVNITAAEWRVLSLLVSRYPNGVSIDEISTAAEVNFDDVRKKILSLKKSHPQLSRWIPRCANGRYRLEPPMEQGAPVKAEPFAGNLQPESQGRTKEIERVSLNDCALRSTRICPRPNFVHEAREEVFTLTDRAFADSHVVFLQGMGGIGKSETAKQWALRRQDRYDTVVFAQLDAGKNKNSVMSLVNDDSIFVINGDFTDRSEYLFKTGREESPEDYFRRKLGKIKEISDERTLIIIDNYDIYDECLTELFDGNYHLLITTRNEYHGHDFPVIKVREITDSDHLKSIFFRNLESRRPDISYNDPWIEQLFVLVSNHTLAVEIIAKSLMNSKETPESVCRRMSAGGSGVSLHEVEGHVRRTHSGSAMTPFQCISLLFDLSKLEYDSGYEYMAQVLSFMALMPTRGIAMWLLRECSSSQTLEALDLLVEKSWLREETVNDMQQVSMHPLIREIVWRELKPSYETCHEYLLQLARACYKAWHREYRMNFDIAGPALSVITQLGISGRYFYIFEPYISLLWQVGQFDTAIKYGHELYDACAEYFGENSPETGYAAKSLGGCYFNCRRLEESLPWYMRGLEAMLESGTPECEDLALAYEKAARCCTWDFAQDFEKAKEYFTKSMDMRLRLIEKAKCGEEVGNILPQVRVCDIRNLMSALGGLKMETGRMYQLLGDYETAHDLTAECYDILIEYNPGNYSSIAYTYYERGVCMYHIGMKNPDREQAKAQLEEALKLLGTAMNHNERMRGRFAFDTADNHEMLGDTYAALDMGENAQWEYLRTIEMLEGLGGVGGERKAAVKEKLSRIGAQQ